MQFSAKGMLQSLPEPFQLNVVAGYFVEDASYRVIRRRGASTFLLMLTVKGEGELTTASDTVAALPGTVALWQPRQYQEYACSSRVGAWEFLWVHFWPRPHWHRWMAWSKATGGRSLISVIDNKSTFLECKDRLTQVVELASSASVLDDHLCLLQLESVLIRCFQQVQQDENRGLDPRLSQVISWCAEHLQEAIGVEDMARVSGMSVSRFSHLFAEQVGETPRNYIEKERMVLARRMLLMSDLPIRAIAQAVGFSSEFHFSNRFRRLNGTSPTAYRQSRGM